MRVVGYVRVSSAEQAESRAGLEAQRAAISAEADRRGWTVVDIVEDAGWSGRDLKRPGVQVALEELRRGRADALVIAKLDRLSRSMVDFAGIMQCATKQGWALVALDLGVDTTTPSGEMMANVLASFAQFERRLIGQRTREALAIKKAQGVRLGRRPELPEPIVDRIVRERHEGRSFAAIAARLDADRVATAHGGTRWYPSTVRSVVSRATLAAA